MKIPKRFKLFGFTINVVYATEPFVEHEGSVGFASYRLNEMQLNPIINQRSKDYREQVFLHELMHFIFYYAGDVRDIEKDMRSDEPFIDMTACLLHQALTTMEYE